MKSFRQSKNRLEDIRKEILSYKEDRIKNYKLPEKYTSGYVVDKIDK